MNRQTISQTNQGKITAVASGVLQRKCACGTHTPGGGNCHSCSKKNSATQLQRKDTNPESSNEPPPIIHEVLRSPGQPLDDTTRAFFEPRFGYDFSNVRVHKDAQAAESAKSVNALAYTVGRDVVFGTGQYAPGTGVGQRTLAHELAHVVQQSGGRQSLQGKPQPGAENSSPQPTSQHAIQRQSFSATSLRIGQPGDAYEQEADSVADAVMQGAGPRLRGSVAASGLIQRTTPPLLQRILVVNPRDTIPAPAGTPATPTPLRQAVQGLLGDTCPDGQFQVNQTTGVVTTRHADFCQPPRPPILSAAVSSTPVGCGCICDVINHAQTTTIAFRAGGPGTNPGSVPGAGPGQGGVATDATVSMDPRFQGQYQINGRWVDVPFHLLFTHELCGHALPKMRGTHVARGANPPGGTPPQEQHAVDVERQIAAEHNPPLPRRPDDYSGAARQRP